MKTAQEFFSCGDRRCLHFMHAAPLKLLKTAAAIVGIIAAEIMLKYIMKAIGCLLIYISETFNIPL
jgi:hypothetical protein|uniref:Uncharacterized protein n=1 Tax=virus sp. ctoYX9 TaxID=2825822 RepID=A0A8S5RPN5_9VIRU|nr:MAG TPA: hypothetical protein [virus sp. ctoYX9]